MKLLAVVPDYASHYYPMAAVAHEWATRVGDVVVATGPALAARVEQDGFRWVELPLGAGRNPGLARPEGQVEDEAENLRGFIAVTRKGMVATVRYQAERRLSDMLWEPERVAERLRSVLAAERPDVVLTDHLAFGATLALRALGRDAVGLLPGHPSALPEGDEPFGFPALRPARLHVTPPELATLRDRCAETSARFTRRWNDALLRIAPQARPVGSAFATRSRTLTLVAYPDELRRGRHAAGPPVEYVGPLVREERLDGDLARRLRRGRRPTVYVVLGSFLSARADVLARIAAGVRLLGARAVIAHGTAPVDVLGPLRRDWIVRSVLPQPAVLAHCDLVICHGGNNTVMEALQAGIPVLAAPLASDQFAGAEDLRRSGLGEVVDPNRALPEEIAWRARLLLADAAAARAAALGVRLRARPGPALAVDALLRRTAASASAA
ncbi:MAG: nucleotide disphospho-sugar-binding domain-containing protein [Pseudomonadota bacterium]